MWRNSKIKNRPERPASYCYQYLLEYQSYIQSFADQFSLYQAGAEDDAIFDVCDGCLFTEGGL